MNKKVMIISLFLLLFFRLRVSAEEIKISAQVTGNFERGEHIQISIIIDNIESFFAGSVKFNFDNSIIKVKSIESGQLISNNDIKKFEAINKVDNLTGKAEYAFSALSKVKGYSGSGTFIKINAEVLDIKEFSIRSQPFNKIFNSENNLILQICDSEIKELNYNFQTYTFNITKARSQNVLTNEEILDNTDSNNISDSNKDNLDNNVSNEINNTISGEQGISEEVAYAGNKKALNETQSNSNWSVKDDSYNAEIEKKDKSSYTKQIIKINMKKNGLIMLIALVLIACLILTHVFVARSKRIKASRSIHD